MTNEVTLGKFNSINPKITAELIEELIFYGTHRKMYAVTPVDEEHCTSLKLQGYRREADGTWALWVPKHVS